MTDLQANIEAILRDDRYWAPWKDDLHSMAFTELTDALLALVEAEREAIFKSLELKQTIEDVTQMYEYCLCCKQRLPRIDVDELKRQSDTTGKRDRPHD